MKLGSFMIDLTILMLLIHIITASNNLNKAALLIKPMDITAVSKTTVDNKDKPTVNNRSNYPDFSYEEFTVLDSAKRVVYDLTQVQQTYSQFCTYMYKDLENIKEIVENFIYKGLLTNIDSLKQSTEHVKSESQNINSKYYKTEMIPLFDILHSHVFNLIRHYNKINHKETINKGSSSIIAVPELKPKAVTEANQSQPKRFM